MATRRATTLWRKQNRFQFMRLPRELRDVVYAISLVKLDPIEVSTEVDAVTPTFDRPGLLFASSQIRDEATKMFFTQNLFQLRDSKNVDADSGVSIRNIEWLQNSAFRIDDPVPFKILQALSQSRALRHPTDDVHSFAQSILTDAAAIFQDKSLKIVVSSKNPRAVWIGIDYSRNARNPAWTAEAMKRGLLVQQTGMDYVFCNVTESEAVVTESDSGLSDGTE